MSTTASAAPTLARSSSASRRQPSYGASADRPHRSQSTRVPTSSYAHSRQSSASQRPGDLNNVARRDFEDPNLPKQSSSRRSTSQDRYGQAVPAAPAATRGEPARRSSRHDNQTAQPSNAPMDAATRSMAAATGAQPRRRTHVSGATGTWQLQKTIGAGSMGKVKLARNQDTGETVAVKIVPRVSTEDHRTQAERERAEHSKEIRTAREAAIVSLVNHPYICGMRDVVKTSYHWYMLFEYVNGGQMLDYIISHGRLKEKQARKFGRQIASALDYCHRNSIVHRDLKIENILISKTGDIKIIDFGLSNLFAPQGHLKTFCGSLYFAAPELLQAKQYTGPEVDVWSFGIVLYVLVCGKVPFDDQSMPQLHAKIKKGHVDYPPWLSPECKNLISRMLVTDPKQRASLQEIMNHPWLTKGFGGPPENFLPYREPLQLPLDPAVIEKMEGFDFGSTEHITAGLTKVIDNEDYQRAAKNWVKKKMDQTPDNDKKRGVFDFYKRRNSTTSRDTLNAPSVEALSAGMDPINAYHPLISVYFLVREKLDRERQEANPGALSIPAPDHGKPFEVPGMPSAPAAAYTNHNTPEAAGEKPTGGRTRPRARTNGEDELADSLGQMRVHEQQHTPNTPQIVTSPAEPSPAKKESTAGSILRRLSTRRTRAERPDRSDRSHPPPTVAVSGPGDAATDNTRPAASMRRSFSVRRNRDRDVPSSNSLHAAAREDQQQQDGLLSPPATGEGFGKRLRGLGRSASVNSSELRRRVGRRGVSEGGSASGTRNDIPATSGSDGSSYAVTGGRSGEASTEQTADTPPSRTKTLGHARRESIQHRRLRRRDTAEQEKAQDTADTEAEATEYEQPERSRLRRREDRVSGSDSMKPVYLKGLFSVSTTSNRPLSEIRSEIIRVLRLKGVEFLEIKGGFSCRHSPSILNSNEKENRGAFSAQDAASPRSPEFSSPPSQPGSAGLGHRRKISFGVDAFRNKEREDFQQGQQTPRTPRSGQYQPSNAHNILGSGNAADNAADAYQPSDDPESSDNDQQQLRPVQPQPTMSSGRGALRDGTTTRVQEDVGEYGLLKFEIFIVKVPLLSLHGIQFKKVEGNVMSYKNMAQEILRGLRL